MSVTEKALSASRGLGEDEAWETMETPVGRLVLAGDDAALRHVLLPNAAAAAFRAGRLDERRRGRPDAVALAEEQLGEYFEGTRRRFDLPLDPRGTAFQRSVWWALEEIAYGETVSYAAIAKKVGRPTAFRAVGLANGMNPLPIVLPCHRVIGSSGKLVGYGGGMELKERLIELERAFAA